MLGDRLEVCVSVCILGVTFAAKNDCRKYHCHTITIVDNHCNTIVILLSESYNCYEYGRTFQIC